MASILDAYCPKIEVIKPTEDVTMRFKPNYGVIAVQTFLMSTLFMLIIVFVPIIFMG